jgi:negative regulator of replication initiation
MRTTLMIDDDILDAARELAARQNRSIGEAVSELARRALRPAASDTATPSGVPLLPVRADARPVTLEMVNWLRDDPAE